MDAALKTQWTAALRSGTYQQGRLTLRSQDKTQHCCLGVLADLCKMELGDSNLEDTNRRNVYLALEQILGLEVIWPLARLNDEGQSFAQIADYIDATL